MAKKEIFVCDKCGKEFEPTDWVRRQLKFTIDIKEDGSGGNNISFDLCHDCCYKYIETLLATENRAELRKKIFNFIKPENMRRY